MEKKRLHGERVDSMTKLMVGCSDNEVKSVEVRSALDAAENGNGRRV